MRQPKVCQLFLESLLGKDIARIEYISKQEDLTDDVSGHGIRLDVYLNDAAGTHYDIEMQKTSSKGLERRIRYYQGGIDRRCLGKGLDYTDLPESYVIFVCDFDYYHAGLARYERVSSINGREDIAYDDGSHAIILNSRYQEGNAPQPILEFWTMSEPTMTRSSHRVSWHKEPNRPYIPCVATGQRRYLT